MNVVFSLTEPDKKNLWLTVSGALLWFGPDGWIPVNHSDIKDVILPITTDDLEDKCVTNVKLANNAVGTQKMRDGCVTTEKLGDNSVNTNKIINHCVSPNKMYGGLVYGGIIPQLNFSPNLQYASFYTATLEGTYPNFNGIVINKGEIANIYRDVNDYSSNWKKLTIWDNTRVDNLSLSISDLNSVLYEQVDNLTEQIKTKQDKLYQGKGISISENNVISCNLDLSLYKIVEELPGDYEYKDPNKIYLVLGNGQEDENVYTEYIWVEEDWKWEKLGEYKATVDLSPYQTKEEAEAQHSAISKHMEDMDEGLEILKQNRAEDSQKLADLDSEVGNLSSGDRSGKVLTSVNGKASYQWVPDNNGNMIKDTIDFGGYVPTESDEITIEKVPNDYNIFTSINFDYPGDYDENEIRSVNSSTDKPEGDTIYTISVFAKGTNTLEIVTGNGVTTGIVDATGIGTNYKMSSSEGKVRAKFQVDNTWRRYSVSFITPTTLAEGDFIIHFGTCKGTQLSICAPSMSKGRYIGWLPNIQTDVRYKANSITANDIDKNIYPIVRSGAFNKSYSTQSTQVNLQTYILQYLSDKGLPLLLLGDGDVLSCVDGGAKYSEETLPAFVQVVVSSKESSDPITIKVRSYTPEDTVNGQDIEVTLTPGKYHTLSFMRLYGSSNKSAYLYIKDAPLAEDNLRFQNSNLGSEIEAGVQYYNAQPSVTVNSYAGFSLSKPETVIVSSEPVTFTGSNVKIQQGIDSLQTTGVYVYVVRYIKVSASKYMLLVNCSCYE